MLVPFIVFTQRTFRSMRYKKNGCVVPISVPGCIQLRPEKHLKHLQNPEVISHRVLSCLNASSCSLALGRSITKYCFSTCYTKSFLKAAGETCWRPDNRGTVCMEWFAAQTLCQRKVTQERHSTSELSVVTFSSFEKRAWQ